MGRDLQKRKRRSSRPVVRQPNRTKKLRNPLGNSTIAKNWNKDETMTQNYRRLGLLARLKAPTGGTEKFRAAQAAKPSKLPFQLAPTEASVITEALVERDEDGNIVVVKSVGSKKRKRDNPLNDPLNDLETDSEAEDDDGDTYEEWGGIGDENDGEQEEPTAVVKELEAEAARVQPPRPRTQSSREQEWIENLVDKHGDDTRAMARDRRLNPMQQTEADISRRLKKWKIAHRMIRPGATA